MASGLNQEFYKVEKVSLREAEELQCHCEERSDEAI
jgi:hypothetical protein